MKGTIKETIEIKWSHVSAMFYEKDKAEKFVEEMVDKSYKLKQASIDGDLFWLITTQ